MGGEAISANEYFGVGKVTEFRYGTKMKDCINGGDFNCLQGIYDQVLREAAKSKFIFLVAGPLRGGGVKGQPQLVFLKDDKSPYPFNHCKNDK